jgi:4a-hydroxytetrahydrobiopterin dehydratase
MTDRITASQFAAAEHTEDWPVLSDGATAFFRTDSYAASARLVQAIGALPGVDEIHPGIDVRHDGVTVRMMTITDDYAGMTRDHVTLAGAISRAAHELGFSTDPTGVQSLLIIPGAPNIGDVTPFWRALLGYEPRLDSPVEDLVDPHDRGPAFWFEQMEEPRADGGGAIHVAVWLPYEQAEARVAAALAAGGRMVRDDFAPAWWTLADAAGNEADIATVKYRD